MIKKNLEPKVVDKKCILAINDECIKSIIENYCDSEKGVRNMKRCLETIYSKLNLYRLMDSNTNLFNKEYTD